jgi:hypothetical protein
VQRSIRYLSAPPFLTEKFKIAVANLNLFSIDQVLPFPDKIFILPQLADPNEILSGPFNKRLDSFFSLAQNLEGV